jgi:putative ABC transport system permease protein
VLIGFGLLMNSHLRLTNRDLNFEPSGLLMFEARTQALQRSLGRLRGFAHFEMLNAPSQAMTRIHERLAAVPGVDSVAGISFPPVDSLILPIMDVRLDRTSADPNAVRARAAYFLVTPGLFSTIGTPLVRGRDVSSADTVGRRWVAVINETAARQFWPGQDPMGRHLTIDVVAEERPREVVGIVRDIPTRHGEVEPQPVVYASYLQQPTRYRGPFGGMFAQMTFMVRHAGDPQRLVPAVRKAVAEVEPRPISSVMTGENRRSLGPARARYNLFLLGILAGTAAILAAIGVYGLLAYSVSQRTREIGLRKALGASGRAVLTFLGTDVVIVMVGGLAIGWVGARLFTRVLASQLWGITATDPLTYVAGAVLLLLAALLACVGPARRAISVDPTVALRSE